MPGARSARSRACSVVNTRVSHHEYAGNTQHSRTRLVLTVSFVLSPAIGLFCHRHRRNCFRQLDAGVEASGPHDFTVRVSAVRHKHCPRPPHPAPTFVMMANAPQWDGTATDMKVICLQREQEYFCKRGWTRPLKNALLICRDGQIRGGPTENAGEGPPSSDTPASPARPRIFLDEQAINF